MVDETDIGLPTDYEFCPDQDQSYLALFALLPPGRAWGTRPFTFDIDTNIKRFIHAIAGSWAKLEADMCAALNEWFCFTSVMDIDAWMRDYGIPDDCDLYNQSVCAKVQVSGPPTSAYLLDLLEQNGYVAVGRWVKSTDPEFGGVRSTFRVVVDPFLSPAFADVITLPFPIGRAFGGPEIEQVRCMLERYIPAHCVVDAQVGGSWEPVSGLGSDLIAWWNADSTVDGAVSTWTDDIASVAATQSGSNRPTSGMYDVGYGSFRFVDFNGAQWLDFVPTALLNGTTPGEVWVCGTQDAAADSLRTEFSYGGAGNYRGVGRTIVSTDHRFQPVMGVASLIDDAQEMSGMFVAGARHDGTKVFGRLNGLPTDPISIADTTINTPTTRGRIGALSGVSSSNFKIGKTKHIFVTKPLTEVKAIRLEAWALWSVDANVVLDGTHPYRNVRP